jgi:hypothetical protein
MSTMLAEVRRTHPTGAPALELVGAPPPAVKARQLFEEARAVSLDHLRGLEEALVSVGEQLDAIVEGGDLYAAGLREFAQKLTNDLTWKTKTLRMLSQRQATSRA